MSRPSALAVIRLMMNSNLAARITGRSAGFSPLRMRPGVDADLAIPVSRARSVAHQVADFDILAEGIEREQLVESLARQPRPGKIKPLRSAHTINAIVQAAAAQNTKNPRTAYG